MGTIGTKGFLISLFIVAWAVAGLIVFIDAKPKVIKIYHKSPSEIVYVFDK